MKTKMKRLTGFLVAAIMLLSTIPVGFANPNFVDFPTGWSKTAMEAAVDNDLLIGLGNNEIRPQAYLTRAEMAAIMVRAFNAQTTANISAYADVSPSAWYYDSIAKAVKMGALNGISATEMAPNAPITREQVFTVMARILVLSSEDTSSLARYNDADQISAWAVNSMAALAERGYVNGDDYGNANPKAYITREEFAQFMYNTICTYIKVPGTYNLDMKGVTVLRVGDVELENLTNSSDLVIGDGVGNDDVKITNVNVEKRLLARGGTITIKNSSIAGGVVVNNVNGVTHFRNYRSESVFDGLIENTKASFLIASVPGGGGGGGRPGLNGGGSTSTPTPTPSVSPSPSPATVTVTFYEGYDTGSVLGSPVTIEKGTKIPAAKIPEIDAKNQIKGYEELASIASVYTGNEYTHYTKPSYWCLNASNEFVPFDPDAAIEQDTDVYLLYKKLSLYFTLKDQLLSVTAAYDDDTRLLDSVKDMVYSGRNQLEKAIDLNMIPYDEIVASSLKELEKYGLVDSNKNIMIMDVPVSITSFINETAAHGMVKSGVRDMVLDYTNYQEFMSYIANLNNISLSVLNAQLAGLDEADKIAFADSAYDTIKSTTAYQDLIHDMLYEETFDITDADKYLVHAFSESIRNMTFEEAMTHASNNELLNKFVDILGEDTFKQYYEAMRDAYCDSVDAGWARVEASGAAESHTSSMTLALNPVELLTKLYAKAQPVIENKLNNASVHYNENIYLQYLVQHDVIGALIDGDGSAAAGKLTGYQLKDILDYYDYLLSVLLVADDALCWYEDTLSAAEYQVFYDAVLGKTEIVLEKLNEILRAYESQDVLPAQAQMLVDQIKKLDELLTKYNDQIKDIINNYLGNDFNQELESGNKEKLEEALKQLFGSEDPTFTIDSLYAVISQDDATTRANLKEMIDNGKLKAAIDKFESTPLGSLFKPEGQFGNINDRIDEINNTGKVQGPVSSVYDLLVLIADYGVDPFKTDEDDVTVEDAYEFTVGNNTFKVKRYYQ